MMRQLLSLVPFLAVALASLSNDASTSHLVHRVPPTLVREVTSSVDQESWYFKGCYGELTDSIKALNHDVTATITGPLTVQSCVAKCSASGYSIAGIQNGNTCVCDYAISSKAPKLADEECSVACTGDPGSVCGGTFRLVVYSPGATARLPFPQAPGAVGTGNATYSNIGCWLDNNPGRALQGAFYTSANMTPAYCASTCYAGGYEFAGVEYGRECFCGQTFLNPEPAEESDCSIACAGNTRLVCGAGDRLQVFVAVFPPSGALRPKFTVGSGANTSYYHLGCFVDTVSPRTFSGYTYVTEEMTADKCATGCAQRRFEYAGVENGSECYCSNTRPNTTQVDSSACNTACIGDRSYSCGGGARLDVYRRSNTTLPV